MATRDKEGRSTGWWHGLFLFCAALLFLLLQVGPADPPPTELTLQVLARQLLAVPVGLFLPGLPLAIWLLRRELHPPAAPAPGGRLDTGLVLLLGGVCSVPLQMGNMALAKLFSSGSPEVLLALTVGESLLLWLGLRTPLSVPLEPSPPSRRRALSFFAATLVLFVAIEPASVFRDASMLFYDADLHERRFEDPVDPNLVLLRGAQSPASWPLAQTFVPESSVLGFELFNDTDSAGSMLLAFLVQGQVGWSVLLDEGSEERRRELLERAPLEDQAEGRVERYWGWGTASLVHQVELAPGQRTSVALRILDELGNPLSSGRLSAVRVLDASHVDPDQTLDLLTRSRFKLVHYHQILNVAENMRWVEQLVHGDRWLTMHQPPLWVWVWAPVRCLAGQHMVHTAFLLLLFLLGELLLCSLALEGAFGRLSVPLLLVPALPALMHGQLILRDVSQNFPDNLFALCVLGAFVTASLRRPYSFVLFALMASSLRYPGAVVCLFVVGSLAAVSGSERKILRGGRAFLTFLNVSIALGLVAALLSSRARQLLQIIWFEFWPEHFSNNPNPLPFHERPLAFAKLLVLYSAFQLPFAFLPGSRMGRAAVLTILAYGGCLAFVDHFSHHYFLPLMLLGGLGSAAAIRSRPEPLRSRLVASALLMGGIALAMIWMIWLD